MRLQVTILRHTLPPVNIIFNTVSGHTHAKTVSELLSAVDQIIPLESADGEWGLEDYVVEVAATSDQSHPYECLHYQYIEDVLREDDEVIIRGLASDEIRERRQGGRLQILSDGRHLFDGVAWGRRHYVHATRPGIIIPPRKRRRLLPAEEDDITQGEEEVQLVRAGPDAQVGIVNNNEEEEFDGDYDDEYSNEDDIDSQDEDEDEDKDEDDTEDQPLQIVTREVFDDADADVDASLQKDESDLSLDQGYANLIEDDELRLLLQEAGEMDQTHRLPPLEARTASPSRKRKRVRMEDTQTRPEDVVFEGFSSTPSKELKTSPNNRQQPNGQVQGLLGNHVVTTPTEGSETPSIHKLDTSSGRDSDNDRPKFDLIVHKSQPRVAPRQGKINELTDSTSSSGDSSSESNSSSGTGSASSSASNSSGSDSISELDEVSSDDSDSESESESENEDDAASVKERNVKGTASNPEKTASELIVKPKVDNPPGTGTKRTRANNHRVKLRKRLAHLKAQGALPAGADFEAMRAYEEDADLGKSWSHLEEEHPSPSGELLQRKEEILARLNAVYESSGSAVDNEKGTIQAARVSPPPSIPDKKGVSITVSDELTQTAVPTETAEISPQRARLDVESARRMLFNSLGVRNPKTPAAEQALKEKLARPARDIQSRPKEQEMSKTTSVSIENSWQNKLIISAVECLQDGLVLSPPPFPFKQGWNKRGNQKKKARLSNQYYEQDQNDETVAVQPDSTHAKPQPEMIIPSSDPVNIIDAAADSNDPPRPNDFGILANLSQNDIRLNTIIAYKQLRLGANYEPEESPYQMARIVAINDDLIDVVLLERDTVQDNSVQYDKETGERIYNKFEMPVDENDVTDDGLRETTFEDMIQPKLIRLASLQGSGNDHVSTAAGILTPANDADMVPESAPQQVTVHESIHDTGVKVDTPRRAEISNIIRNAGFDSAVDEQLLEPIGIPQLRGPGGNLMDAGPSSPPSVSMVETVDYPHFSHIDINHSELTRNTASSSYQDAQRLSPDMVVIDNSDLSHLLPKQLGGLIHDDSQNTSLPSSVPLSQPSVLSSIQNEVLRTESSKKSTGLDRDYEPIDTDHGNGSDDFNSDNLPTLQELTSSQRLRSIQNKQPSTSSRALLGVSPPPVRRNNTRIESSETSTRHSKSPDSGIKISASQKPAVDISKIPRDEDLVVDLTVSSDPVEANNSDDDDADEGDIDYDSPRARRAAARSNKTGGSQTEHSGISRASDGGLVELGSKRGRGRKARSRV